MKNIIVTGGSGKAGRATCRELLGHGYEVMNLDTAPPVEAAGYFVKTDVTDLAQILDIFGGVTSELGQAEAIVHLAAIPTSAGHPESVTFATNTQSTYNLFTAAAKYGIERIVWASSETLLGLDFDREPPAYAPLDEDAPLKPESPYALSKSLGEEMARQFARWHPGTVFAGLRFSNIMEPHDYAGFESFQDDPWVRKWNLWGYVDSRDVAQACRLGLEADISGAEVFIIAAADTVMRTPNRELMAAVFPDVEIRGQVGDHDTLLSIEKARRLLGYAPSIPGAIERSPVKSRE